MGKLLVIVAFQNDFISGSLGTPEARGIIQKMVEKAKNWDGDIVCTEDTHYSDYLKTNEGKHLPVAHCILGTNGHLINSDLRKILEERIDVHYLTKNTFGSTKLVEFVSDGKYDYVELVGLCTDICVISNALLLKAFFPEITIAVDPSCCAGVTPESHKEALDTMKMCQIDMIGDESHD